MELISRPGIVEAHERAFRSSRLRKSLDMFELFKRRASRAGLHMRDCICNFGEPGDLIIFKYLSFTLTFRARRQSVFTEDTLFLSLFGNARNARRRKTTRAESATPSGFSGLPNSFPSRRRFKRRKPGSARESTSCQRVLRRGRKRGKKRERRIKCALIDT
jgi:hypothetical protein